MKTQHAVIILPESQDRSSQSGLLATVLPSPPTSLRMRTQTRRWSFWLKLLRTETASDIYRHIHTEAACCLV